MEIRVLCKNDISEAMRLVAEVFDEFEAPEYEQRGAEEFRRFIEPEAIARRMDASEMALWGCFDEARIAGVIAVKNRGWAPERFDHVCLLFVKKEYHRKGIARQLFGQARLACEKAGADTITVNSSPYAAEAYRRMGFVRTDGEKTVNGIRFVPMQLRL